MYGSKMIKVYLFTYICKLLKCISIESGTNQWSEMEHTNYEIQVYLLLLFIFIIQTYIPFFLFLLLKLSTHMFNSVFLLAHQWRLRWKSNFCQHFEWTFHLHLYRCIRARRAGPRSVTTVYNRTALSMIILILLYSRCNTNLSALLRTSSAVYWYSFKRVDKSNNSLHLCRSST